MVRGNVCVCVCLCVFVCVCIVVVMCVFRGGGGHLEDRGFSASLVGPGCGVGLDGLQRQHREDCQGAGEEGRDSLDHSGV